MLTVVSDNELPEISNLRVIRNATSDIEAKEMFARSASKIVLVSEDDKMPYVEKQRELPLGCRPTLREFREGDFRLTVENFVVGEGVPFIGFSVEKETDVKELFVRGSQHVLDPKKNHVTKPSVAVIPLLYVFNQVVKTELDRAVRLAFNAPDASSNMVSLQAEKQKTLMDIAFSATGDLMDTLCVDTQDGAVPMTDMDSVSEKLEQTLSAGDDFYEVLMKEMCDLFEPSIRTLAEDIALGKMGKPVYRLV